MGGCDLLFAPPIARSPPAGSPGRQLPGTRIVKSDRAIANVASRRAPAEWLTRPERGSMLLLRIMAGVSRLLGRARSRMFLYLIATYFVLFAPAVRRNARNYLRRALRREPKFSDRFRQ